MQHTEKRNFNIIETSDAFSPEALNENTRKIEAALDGVEAYADSGDTALGERISGLAQALGSGGSTARLAYGSYVGTGTGGQDAPMVFHFGFVPLVMWVDNMMLSRQHRTDTVSTGTIVTDDGHTHSTSIKVAWLDDGVTWYRNGSYGTQFNYQGITYRYCVLGYDPAS